LQLVPTAGEYRTIASRLESAGETVLSLRRCITESITESIEASPLTGGGESGSVGRLQRTVLTALAVTSANLTEIAAELDRQIAEARRRASVCDRYAEAVLRYHRCHDLRTTFPPRPASWADHGW
jgi:hypothetical protein